MKRGRRVKDPTTFRPDWKEIMLEAGRKGKPYSYFQDRIGIGHTHHHRLVKRNEEYRLAFEEYLVLHENWWLDQAKKMIEKDGGETFDTRLFVLMMGNKHRKTWKRNENL